MSRLDNINVAMRDGNLQEKVVAAAAWLKIKNPDMWAAEHFKALIGENIGSGSEALADMHVGGLAAAAAAYALEVTDADVNAAILQRLDFIGVTLAEAQGVSGTP